MQFDKKGKVWFYYCLAAAILLTATYAVRNLIPAYDRIIHTMLGTVATLGILFCGALPWVKKLPKGLKSKLQSKFTNGHPWVGLLAAWCVLLHTDFKLIHYFNATWILYYLFFVITITGIIAMYFRHFQVLKKLAEGSEKKEMAGWLMILAFEISFFIHDFLHASLYPLIMFHIYVYVYYGRLW